MVQIVDYKTYQREDGTEFFTLIVQGGLETVVSKQTGRAYLTARTASVPCTFNELTCKSLIGTQLTGNVRRVDCEPYSYTVRDTGEILELSHRYEFVSEEESIIRDNVVKAETVF